MSGFDFADRLAQKTKYKVSKADFLDGIHPVKRRVVVKIDTDGRRLTIVGEGADEAWAFDDLRLLPSESRAGHLTLTLGDNGTPRLVLTETHLIAELLDAHPDLGATAPTRGQVKTAVLAGLGAVAALAGIIAVLMPMLAQRLAPMISPEAEVAFATTMRNQTIDRMFPTCGDAASDAAWDSMVTALTAGLDVPYDLDVSIVRSPEINAFAMPGGQIVFFSGLIEAAGAPDEVAAVLAHEIAHVVYRDVTVSMLRQTGTYGLLGLMVGDLGASAVPAMAENLLNATHSQAAETRADTFAHARLEAAGQSPEALGRLFQRMVDRYGEEDLGLYAHFSSHPQLSGRIEAAEHAGHAETSTPILTDAEWQALRTACNTSTWADVPPIIDLEDMFGLPMPSPDGPSQPPRPTEPTQRTEPTRWEESAIEADPAPTIAIEQQAEPVIVTQPVASPPEQPQPSLNLPQVGGGQSTGGARFETVTRPEAQTTSPDATEGPVSNEQK